MLAKLLGTLLGATILGCALPAFAEPPPIFVGGQFIRQHGLEDERGHLLVPIRGVFEAFGATVVYTPPRFVVVRKHNAVIAGLVVGRQTAVVGNRRRTLDAAPTRRNGRIYVPLRSIAEIAGADVRYSSQPRIVDIRLPNNDLAVHVPAPVIADVPADSTLPLWALALVGVFVLGFLLEVGRRLAVVLPRRSSAGSRSALPLASRALQLPYAAGAGDHHGVGEIGK